MVLRTGPSRPYVVQRNERAPLVNTWAEGEVAGYANTIREADALARRANSGRKVED